ncbi:MAG TPA: hypothetical protein VEV83_04800 [Parafilimonas sp.]|nr:hypothetical protein [Parafilimonas sp.]
MLASTLRRICPGLMAVFVFHLNSFCQESLRHSPVINYTLKIDPADFTSLHVEMDISNLPDTFQVAMVAHPGYDDRYWRFIKDMDVEDKNGKAKIIRQDSALWRIIVNDSRATLSYTLQLPPKERNPSTWKPFIDSSGALIGGTHSFMYVVGATNAPSHISLQLPKYWQVATSLTPTTAKNVYYAPSVEALTDAPILAGTLKVWPFTVDGIRHDVVYYSKTRISFDSASLVDAIKKIVEQASALFRGLPYKKYLFLLRDNAYGALEHRDCLTLGAPASELEKDLQPIIADIAHEYFHAWNLMRIRPAEFGDPVYKTPPLSRGLWWSEGLTMFYADLLLRRAGLPVYDSTRTAHLEKLIARYYNSPGNQKNVEEVSMAEFAPPGLLGDYIGSTHVQGELLGNMLDLLIRYATNGERSIDDAIRKMFEISGGKGFTNGDIEKIVSRICGCEDHQFFNDYITGNKVFDFNVYLQLIGLHATVSWKNAQQDDGKPAPDLRVYAFIPPNQADLQIGIVDPANCWGNAGLHTGDRLLSINDSLMTSRNDFYSYLRRVHIGDTLYIAIQKASGISKTRVVITGYQQAWVKIEEIADATEKQKALRSLWVTGKN